MSATIYTNTILVVDDNDTTLTAVEDALKSRGYEVHARRTVEEGKDLLQSKKYAVALIDINFNGKYKGPNPETAGMEVLEAALQTPFLEAILMTAFETLDTAIKGLQKGAFDYLVKGAKRDEADFLLKLVTSVERALDTREVHKALFESICEMRRCLVAFSRAGIISEHLDAAINAEHLAEQAYQRLLKTRGKGPESPLDFGVVAT
jgi:DNA-binding NtrC family response regulator